jgi:hypothetical protein
MKTASSLLQSLALSACLAACLGGSDEARMPGVRKALQTMAGTPSLPTLSVEAILTPVASMS